MEPPSENFEKSKYEWYLQEWSTKKIKGGNQVFSESSYSPKGYVDLYVMQTGE